MVVVIADLAKEEEGLPLISPLSTQHPCDDKEPATENKRHREIVSPDSRTDAASKRTPGPLFLSFPPGRDRFPCYVFHGVKGFGFGAPQQLLSELC